MKTAGFLLIAALIASPAAAQNGKYRQDEKRQQQKADYWDARYTDSAINSGYRDGFEQGKVDALRSMRKDISRDGKYRSATRGYEQRYGAQGHYQNYYRQGFRRGYDDAFNAQNSNKNNGYNRATQKQKR